MGLPEISRVTDRYANCIKAHEGESDVYISGKTIDFQLSGKKHRVFE